MDGEIMTITGLGTSPVYENSSYQKTRNTTKSFGEVLSDAQVNSSADTDIQEKQDDKIETAEMVQILNDKISEMYEKAE